MARIKEQEIFVNPYVVQMDKFAESLQHLSKTFLNMEHYPKKKLMKCLTK